MIAEARPAPPATLRIAPENFPKELADLDQWIAWRWEWDEKEGRYVKIPINPRTGNRASSTNAKTWAPFPLALAYYDAHRDELAGLMFVLSEDDPYFVIDQDNVIDPATGELNAEAQTIVRAFETYTQVSARGNGVHSIGRGTKPGSRCRRNGSPIEIYDQKRVLTMTGHVRGFAEIADCQQPLDSFYSHLFPEPDKPAGPAVTFEPLNLADVDLLERCEGSPKFRRLMTGDDADYGDDASSADLAFCNLIVRNSGSREQVDALMRRFRYRPKWDQRRGDRTYGERTIDEAFDGTVVPFEARQGPNRQDAVLVINAVDGDLPDDIPSLKVIILNLQRRVVAAEERAASAELRAIDAEHRADTALERAREQIDLRDKTAKILANKHLGQERVTAAAMVSQFAKRKPDEKGRIRTPLMTIARAAGVSEDTASKQLKKLEKLGVIERTIDWLPQQVNPTTGEITGGHRALFIAPASNVTDFAAAVAALQPDTPKSWGGNRPRCAAHPDADVRRETVWSCAECGEELQRKTEVIRPNPQDDGLLEPTGTDGGTYPSRGRNVISRNPASSHKSRLTDTIDAPPGSVAAAWIAGQPLPPADHERWTL